MILHIKDAWHIVKLVLRSMKRLKPELSGHYSYSLNEAGYK